LGNAAPLIVAARVADEEVVWHGVPGSFQIHQSGWNRTGCRAGKDLRPAMEC
jgi:hypothetical protein